MCDQARRAGSDRSEKPEVTVRILPGALLEAWTRDLEVAPIVYPVANFPDETGTTGIGKAPAGRPPAGGPPIPSTPPTVQPGGKTATHRLSRSPRRLG
jgi:hypothetical protein